MALLEILLEGDPRLRQKALRIRNVDDSLRRLADDMYETMLAAPGVGLAAPQVGVLRRLIWVHVPENFHEEDGPELSIPLVNPEIVKASGRILGYEGCLSIPKIREDINRHETVTLEFMNENFEPQVKTFTGLTARVILHEYDHIEGKLFIDHISPLKRKLMKGRLNDISKGKISVDYKMLFPKK